MQISNTAVKDSLSSRFLLFLVKFKNPNNKRLEKDRLDDDSFLAWEPEMRN